LSYKIWIKTRFIKFPLIAIPALFPTLLKITPSSQWDEILNKFIHSDVWAANQHSGCVQQCKQASLVHPCVVSVIPPDRNMQIDLKVTAVCPCGKHKLTSLYIDSVTSSFTRYDPSERFPQLTPHFYAFNSSTHTHTHNVCCSVWLLLSLSRVAQPLPAVSPGGLQDKMYT